MRLHRTRTGTCSLQMVKSQYSFWSVFYNSCNVFQASEKFKLKFIWHLLYIPYCNTLLACKEECRPKQAWRIPGLPHERITKTTKISGKTRDAPLELERNISNVNQVRHCSNCSVVTPTHTETVCHNPWNNSRVLQHIKQQYSIHY